MSRKDSISLLLHNAGLAISNGRGDPIIAPALAALGFDDGRFQEGADLLAQARDRHDAQIHAYARQQGATAARNQAWQAADRTYAQHRQLAKLALGKTGDQGTAILLHERRVLRLNGWLVQAGVFYSNALGSPEILAALAQYNLTSEELRAGETAVAHIQDLEAAQERAKSTAQHATRSRDVALNALTAWLSEYRTLARLALTGPHAQLLESLGFGVVA
ncbi:MAG: hypothetical protein H6659_01735 [Ardenticatenaceae bacterium]|nr:hypothetical protein [Ardenticatenaceae bacterium]MCB8988333.1 hypothetical protein [Ardenticatenaceae bacterium]